MAAVLEKMPKLRAHELTTGFTDAAGPPRGPLGVDQTHTPCSLGSFGGASQASPVHIAALSYRIRCIRENAHAEIRMAVPCACRRVTHNCVYGACGIDDFSVENFPVEKRGWSCHALPAMRRIMAYGMRG